MHSAFADEQVMAGSCLIAALTTQIACSMALDPCVVHRELSERAKAKILVCPSTRGRQRFGGHAGDRRLCVEHLAGGSGNGAMAVAPMFTQHH